MSNELEAQIALRFIQRRDIKAVQFASGAYIPDRELKHPEQFGPSGFQLVHLQQHLAGTASYGHYLLDNDSRCRLFAFDIDLRKTGFYNLMTPWDGIQPEAEWLASLGPYALGDPLDPKDQSLRQAWLNRAHPSRPWIKTQMGMIVRKFVGTIQKELGIACAAAYSGNKGVHVYGFTGNLPAADVRVAANYIMESTDDWELERGNSQWKHKLQDPDLGYPNFSVEVFPKQDNLDDKDLGNLMRLPLGKNLKSPDPAFFLDLNTPVGVMAPHSNPLQLLTSGDPYC